MSGRWKLVYLPAADLVTSKWLDDSMRTGSGSSACLVVWSSLGKAESMSSGCVVPLWITAVNWQSEHAVIQALRSMKRYLLVLQARNVSKNVQSRKVRADMSRSEDLSA